MSAVTFHDAKADVCDPVLMLFDTPEWISLTLREIVEKEKVFIERETFKLLEYVGPGSHALN